MSVSIENSDNVIESLIESIEAIAKREGISTLNYDIQREDTTGTSFLGNLFKVVIKDESKEVNLFVKAKPSDGVNTKFISMNDVYSRELFAYKDLSDVYKQIQEAANIPFEERYTFVKCYEESNTNLIFIEDVSKIGYENCDRLEIISMDFAQKCIKQLAKFHALSFVLEKERLDYFNSNIKLLKYPFIFNEDFVKFISNMQEVCLNHLEGEYKIKLESIRDVCDKHYHFWNNTSVIRCLCHGDYRAMNIMMTCRNDEITNIIPIDYQNIYYGSPVIDLLFFIFGSTDREFRIQHLDSLKNLYHDTMAEFLNYFNINIDLYYPRKEFDKAYEQSLEFAVLFSTSGPSRLRTGIKHYI